MNIILISGGIRKGQNSSLSHRQAIVIAVVCLLIMPTFFAVLTFQTLKLTQPGQIDSDIIGRQQAQLQVQSDTLLATRRDAESHLNALAQRLGRLQAQVLRLNALGGRLTRMAGLDTKEFDFHIQPAMGGPAADIKGSSQSPNEFLGSLAALSTQIEQQTARLTALQSILIDNQLQAAVTPAGWPVHGGWMSSSFGARNDPFTGRKSNHHGVDIASPMGSSIMAMGDGVITYAGAKTGYGNMVEVNHGQGYATRYAHASTVTVKVGDIVTRGDIIAKVGTSGRSTGPHLHFEVIRGRNKVDPVGYLQQSPSAKRVTRARPAKKKIEPKLEAKAHTPAVDDADS